MSGRLSVVVLGMAGSAPFAGVAWQTLHYLEGLRRLGHDVVYLEDTERWPYDPVANSVSDDATGAIGYLARLAGRCGLEDRWAYRDVATGGTLHGLSERALDGVLAGADLLVNLSGATVLREEHMRVPVRVYLETDPVLPQIEVAQGREFTIALLDAHTHHFTYGENLGAPDCEVPVERYEYLPTRQPVVLDWWAPDAPPEAGGRPFTTVGNWRQTSKDVEWRGERYTWSKDVEFRRFVDLPRRVTWPLELALAIDDDATVAMLQDHGWTVRDALRMSGDVERYRDYVRGSAGEFTVAKDQNVRLRSGWFSDRTACYLAAGRPAIVQDTAFDAVLPTGEGLFAFATPDEAAAAFDDVAADYARHSAAALAIAREHFDAESVLADLLDRAAAKRAPA
jgi:hypothetical protein